MSVDRPRRWPALVGLVVSALLLWWTLHDVSLAKVWDHLRRARLGPFLAATILTLATFPLRTVRWRYLLRLEGATLPFAPLWHATAIGFMGNNLLPARAGEAARAYVTRRLTGVGFSTALASIAVERSLDGVGIVVLLMIAIWKAGFSPGTELAGLPLAVIVRSAGLLFTLVLLLAVALVSWPRHALRFASGGLRRWLPERWALWLVEGLRGVLAGLDALRSPARLTHALLWTAVIWLLSAAAFGLAFVSFGLELPPSAALMVMGLSALGVAVPSSPGFFGPFEAACRVSLALYGVPASSAVSFAVGFHLAIFLPITLLGLWSLARAQLHLADLKASQQASGTEVRA
jgi:uncharacterized protein (TIRG00374 family)